MVSRRQAVGPSWSYLVGRRRLQVLRSLLPRGHTSQSQSATSQPQPPSSLLRPPSSRSRPASSQPYPAASQPQLASSQPHFTSSPQTPGNASSSAPGPIRRGRGPTKANCVTNLSRGQTMPVNLISGCAIGANGQSVTTFLGVLNRIHCPLWQQDYLKLLDDIKENILRDLVKISERNKANRANLTMPYRRGRTSIHQV
ncbi:hypothetical protein Taro_017120 [Colocasia esculenta]|uniref:Uncharacterized protein n=1 Tax=Colocasia esculenta TaxID=4460 RepID=A0A843UYG5_COLES|nr:hypothetical protein [Colocasia esculenta]